MRILILAATLAMSGGLARAEVVDSSTSGFEVRSVVTIKAPAAKVFPAMLQIGRWWSPDHTYSGNAANLRIEPVAGGCWCEAWTAATVSHMRVVYLERGKTIRFFGGLGPLQNTGAAGHLTWAVTEKDDVSTVTWTYDVGGYVKGGAGAFAAPVDEVLSEQLDRFKALMETGKPG